MKVYVVMECVPHEGGHVDLVFSKREDAVAYIESEGYVEKFHALHEKTYGYRNPDKGVEIVNIRLRARGGPEKPRLQKQKIMGKAPPPEAFLGEKPVVFDHRRTHTKIMARDKLNSGNRIHGPAILVEYSSTIVIPPFANAVVDEYGNIVMEIIP